MSVNLFKKFNRIFVSEQSGRVEREITVECDTFQGRILTVCRLNSLQEIFGSCYQGRLIELICRWHHPLMVVDH